MVLASRRYSRRGACGAGIGIPEAGAGIGIPEAGAGIGMPEAGAGIGMPETGIEAPLGAPPVNPVASAGAMAAYLPIFTEVSWRNITHSDYYRTRVVLLALSPTLSTLCPPHQSVASRLLFGASHSLMDFRWPGEIPSAASQKSANAAQYS